MTDVLDGKTAGAGRWPRRDILKIVGALGATSIFGRALVTVAAEQPQVSDAMVREAEWISGVGFTDDERKLMLEGVNELLESFQALRELEIANGVAPAVAFQPVGNNDPGQRGGTVRLSKSVAATRPADDTDLAFLPVTELAGLIRSRQISSVELTRLYLSRLKRFDPSLHCVITRTDERALRQAERADREIAAGRYRGPLHGIPWGAKDLLSVAGYPTTWGATPYKDQTIDETATVVRRLDEAGAVLVAKLSLGALAWGDVWYDGTTKNPWNVEQGSSGSSAGSASATSAGLAGFTIGTETWGSIVSPCTRCGVTGLRPTFGRVSRHGAMALSWTMDKIGPIARSVEDTALVFDAIQGRDGLDTSVVDRPFSWPLERDIRTLRVGYVASLFEEDRSEGIEDEERRASVQESQEFDRRSLEILRGMGLNLVPIELPDEYPVRNLSFVLTAEAATAFDELTRSGRDDLMVRQIANAWPNVFRQGQLIPAVEYLRANRVRTLVMQEMERKLADVDLYVCPSFGGINLLLTNLTGHPAVVLPNGFRSSDDTPTSITFNGRLHGETELLAVARAYQRETDYHLRRPPVGR